MKIFYFYELGSWKYLRKTNKFLQKKGNTINYVGSNSPISPKIGGAKESKGKEETNKKKKKRK